MKLHEYQAKALLADYTIPVLASVPARTSLEAAAAASTIGCPVMLKAQVHAGARGKAGGIRRAGTPEEAAALADGMLGHNLRTAQTGPQGLPVHAVLVERAVPTGEERYVAYMVDPSVTRVTCIASARGGTSIEDLAASSPEALLSVTIDPLTGLLGYQARRLATFLNPPKSRESEVVTLLLNAYQLFTDRDCSLLELNPLAFLDDGRPMALDAKISIDDSALFRHPDMAAFTDETQLDAIEREAANIGVSYVKMQGRIGCLVNGAGLAMATMDLVTMEGGSPANFLDVGGAASEDQVCAALGLLLDDPDVTVAWVNIFGGILRCDIVARALVRVMDEHTRTVPFVVRLRGTNATEATELLRTVPQGIHIEPDLAAAARLAVSLSKGGAEG